MATDRGNFLCNLTVLFALPLWLAATPAAAEGPLSAIDWLSRSVTVPPATGATGAAGAKRGAEPPVVSGGALPETVTTNTIDAASSDGAGLFPPSVTGLPRDLWGMGLESDIVAEIAAERPEPLPALQGLVMMLMLAEAAPPADSARHGKLLLARVDKLLDMGALDQAQALIDASGPMDAPLFRRAFDIALLTGEEDRGCEMMRALPNLAPTFPARIFCLARSGDWNAAALTLRTAQALGQVDPNEDALLSRFLDPDLYEGEAVPPVPSRISPLTWRLFEAIGEPLSTNTLPLAFAHAELRETAGLKAQIEAAERLARVGAISPNRLLGLYTEKLPAASGGVWDRVDAVQQFDAALQSQSAERVARTLPAAWTAMAAAELEVPFALLYAEDLTRLALTGEAASTAFTLGLLSPRYEQIARAHQPSDQKEAFLVGLATGNLTGTTAPDSLGRAIAAAFQPSVALPGYQDILDQRRLGEGLLMAARQISQGLEGQLSDVTTGLAFLRHAGLEDVARRTALQLMLLERRG